MKFSSIQRSNNSRTCHCINMFSIFWDNLSHLQLICLIFLFFAIIIVMTSPVSRSKQFEFLPPANEGYVFTGVCLPTGGGGSAPCMLGYTYTHWEDTTHPLGKQPPPPPQADTPCPEHAGIHPLPSACWDIPLRSACWDTVNKRAVHIPLECILVKLMFL